LAVQFSSSACELRRKPVPDERRVWHKNGVMTPPRSPRQHYPLDHQRLEELALRYVERYATSRKKLCTYLSRKLRERGWNEDDEPELEALASRLSELGYVNDEAYALARSRELIQRGHGKRRLEEKMHLAGIADEDGVAARALADEAAVDAALRFAERRRIGPFAAEAADSRQREKAIATMVRAGHSFALARLVASLAPGSEVDREELRDRSGMSLT
jgi:regulatory protein